ncbi:MAG: hypothetical protein JWM91_3208 [Rhodospirillales bacterium]|nr:hypothetical protein [Rhodospirillales bacterium]
MTSQLRMPGNSVRAAWLLLFSILAWISLAATAGMMPAVAAPSICGLHGTTPYEHCWRCYALAVAAIGLTLGAFRAIRQPSHQSSLH